MKKLKPYLRAIPKILMFSVVLSLILFGITAIIKWLFGMLIRSTGRAALSTGDMGFLFTTPQGWLIILLGLVVLIVYVVLEINTMIFYSQNLLHGAQKPMRSAIKKGLMSSRKMITPRGLLIVLFIAFVFPLIGAVFSISLTRDFYIPNFIRSVIDNNPFFSTGYCILLIVLFLFFMFHIFVLHGILSEDVEDKEAMKQSRRMVRKNLWHFIRENLLFLLFYYLTAAIVIAATTFLPYVIIELIAAAGIIPEGLENGLIVFFIMLMFTEAGLTIIMLSPMCIMKLTSLYDEYKTGEKKAYKLEDKNGTRVMWIIISVFIVVLGVLSIAFTSLFEQFMPKDVTTGIIAHRAGGYEAPENTVEGLNYSIGLGAMGGEIDIQRTKDGYYVVNHDPDFARVAGESRTSSEMTLEEIKQLKVEGKAPVATAEEMLDASKDKITLFVELKGDTADEKMADDAVRMIKERGMEKQAVVISLQYDLIDYIEKKYDDILTGYLCFASFGDTASIPCDYLGIEEESATSAVIDSVHAQGKKIMVWTPNIREDQATFLKSKADAIITDNITSAKEETKRLNERSVYEKAFDMLFDIFMGK